MKAQALGWLGCVVVVGGCAEVDPDAQQAAVARLPERSVTGALQDADRSGDLRAEARRLLAVLDDPERGPITLRDVGITSYAVPPSIRVWRRRVDGSASSCTGRVDVIPFEQYVKGVLPHEWISSWDPVSLEAGSVAIRTYAAWWVAAGGKYDCADLDDTTASQVYEDEFLAKTDTAVDATSGVVAERDGSLVFAEYSAENSDPTADGVDEPLCTGRELFGHGRGMCQWGSQRWALDGQTYDWIVEHYYPGAVLAGGPAGAPDAGVEPGEPDAAPPVAVPDAGGPGSPLEPGDDLGGGCRLGGGHGNGWLILGVLALWIRRRRRQVASR